MRRPQGDLDAVAGSWTIEREEDGYVQHGPEILKLRGAAR
jgi:hypothetical protein